MQSTKHAKPFDRQLQASANMLPKQNLNINNVIYDVDTTACSLIMIPNSPLPGHRWTVFHMDISLRPLCRLLWFHSHVTHTANFETEMTRALIAQLNSYCLLSHVLKLYNRARVQSLHWCVSTYNQHCSRVNCKAFYPIKWYDDLRH